MNYGWIPPQSKEIEKDVLSVIINRPELIYQIEDILDLDCFYYEDHQIIFSMIHKIHASGAFVSQSAIIPDLVSYTAKPMLPIYQEIKRFFSSDRALIPNAEVLAEMSTKRALIHKAGALLTLIKNDAPIEEIESEVAHATEIVLSRNRSTEAITMENAVDAMYQLMDRPTKNGITGMPTGISSLDRITGGWEEDDMVIIAGRPGQGKTIAASFHAHYGASVGNPTAFISGEVQPSKMAGRMISSRTGFPSSDITKGRLADNQRKIVMEDGEKAKSLPLYFYDNSKSMDINDLSRTLRTWHRKYGLKIVYIDYIGLLEDRTVKNQSDATATTTSIMKKLTRLKNQLKIPFIVFSQLNRENEGKADKRPMLSNLKSSGKLEEDATRVIFLYRQDYYDAMECESKGEEFIPSNDIEYIFAKNREGRQGTLLMKCDVRTNKVYDQTTPVSMTNTSPPQEQMNIAWSKNEALDQVKTTPF